MPPRPRKPDRGRPTKGGRPPRRPHRDVAAAIDYRNPNSMWRFLSDRGKIRSRRATGLSRRDQARLAREVKRARELALLPYPGPADAKPPRS